jgi:hypothetical protein
MLWRDGFEFGRITPNGRGRILGETEVEEENLIRKEVLGKFNKSKYIKILTVRLESVNIMWMFQIRSENKKNILNSTQFFCSMESVNRPIVQMYISLCCSK